MEDKQLKTTLTLKLKLVTNAGDSQVATRIRNFVERMAYYDGDDYEVIADKCGDNTVIKHNGMNGKSFTYRDVDCFFERVFELDRESFMRVVGDIAHLESVTSNTEETVETE